MGGDGRAIEHLLRWSPPCRAPPNSLCLPLFLLPVTKKGMPRATSRAPLPLPHRARLQFLYLSLYPSPVDFCTCGMAGSHFITYGLISNFPSPIMKEIAFAPLSVPGTFVSSYKLVGLFLGFSALFHLSMSLFLCQHHAALITLASWQILKSISMMFPVLFFLFKTALALGEVFCGFTWLLGIFFPFYLCEGSQWRVDGGRVVFADCFCHYGLCNH